MGRDLLRRKTLNLAIAFCLASIPLAAFESKALPLVAWKDVSPSSERYQPQALPISGELLPQPLFHIEIPDHPAIAKFEAYLEGEGRSWIEDCLSKSVPYRDFIFRTLEEHDVPPEFFYLAAVESGFSTTAVSRVGAVGMWQFMKNSIGGYDMRVTPYIDERKDFWKSTIGAIRKIKDNYRHFGDWYLALAAYNAGVPRIDRAIRKSGGIRDYWKLVDQKYLPRETSAYIPQLLAMVKLTSSLTKSGLPMTWDDGPSWSRIPIDKTIDLRMLADAAQIPLDQLLAANRELRYPITPSAPLPYLLKVPSAWAPQVEDALKDPNLKLIRFYFYTVRRADTLSQIAQWYGVTIPMVLRYNPNVNPDSLRVDQTLVIPALKDVGEYRKPAPAPAVAAKGPVVLPPSGATYQVQKGDTLSSIARKFATSVDVLLGLNRLSEDSVLKINQSILLPRVGTGAANVR